jgi:glycosyltransferase involved in cell wall biosynthesis
VIEPYSDRVFTVLKQNGGQGSAFNAGFEHVSGDIVIFLDADDLLDESIAARVAAAFAQRSELAKVHYRLDVIDRLGRRTGGLAPPARDVLPAGDLRELVRRHPDDLPHPPSSGNAFAAWAVARVLPMPEEDYRLQADNYLFNLVPLLGPVAVLDGTGGRYRIHGENAWSVFDLDARPFLALDRVRATLRTTHTTHAHMKKLAESLGLEGFPDPARDDRSLVFLSHRLISLKLDHDLHPLPTDRLARLALRGATEAARRSTLPMGMRILYILWFLAFPIAPRRVACGLAEQMLYPEHRGRLSWLVEHLRKPS